MRVVCGCGCSHQTKKRIIIFPKMLLLLELLLKNRTIIIELNYDHSPLTSSALLLNSSCHEPTLEWNMIIKAFCRLRLLHKIHYMTAWRMVCLPTWAPGVKEQDELNPSRSPQGQGVAAYRCVRGRADGQGHHVPGGAGDSGAPGWSVNVGRQTKGGPSAILLRGLRTCM